MEANVPSLSQGATGDLSRHRAVTAVSPITSLVPPRSRFPGSHAEPTTDIRYGVRAREAPPLSSGR